MSSYHIMKEKVLVAQLCPNLCDPMDCSLLARFMEFLCCPWNYLGKNTIPFSRGIFPTQGSNSGLLDCRQIFFTSDAPGKPNHIIDSCKTKNVSLCSFKLALNIIPKIEFLFTAFSTRDLFTMVEGNRVLL